jgi:hypothetical protein
MTTFKYAEQSVLAQVFPDYIDYMSRKHLINWTGSNPYTVYDIPNNPSEIFFDGQMGTEVQDTPNSAIEWQYVNDSIIIYWDTDPNDDGIVESGVDPSAFADQQLVNASMELNNMLDARFPRPIPKAIQYEKASPEYDYIIQRATCLLAAKNIVKSAGDYELGDKIYSELVNEQSTGLIDKLNLGDYKLAFEIDKTDAQGDIVEVTKTGSMGLAETYGEWQGALYDRIQVICTTQGDYGVCEVSVKQLDDTSLYGNITTNIVITGGLQHLAGGVYGRFEGSAMAEDDRWDIVVHNTNLTQTNSKTHSVNITRR